MAQDYLKHPDLARYDVRFIFKPGDLVLLRQRQPGKLVTKARGPYTFQQYTGSLGVTAWICAADGTRQVVSALNLLPMHPLTAAQRRIPTEDEQSDTSSDNGSNMERPEVINPPTSIIEVGAGASMLQDSGRLP